MDRKRLIAHANYFAPAASARVRVGRRSFSATADAPAREGVTLAGYAIVFGQLSSDRGGYRVRLAKGSPTFQTPTLAIYDHDRASVLGNTAAGTLRIGTPDDYGVPVEIDLPDTTLGRDTAVLIGRGDVGGMSFHMDVLGGPLEYTEANEGGTDVLTFTRFSVDEVTVTAWGSFAGTSIDVKPDDEDDAGRQQFSRRTAAAARLHDARIGMAAALIGIAPSRTH